MLIRPLEDRDIPAAAALFQAAAREFIVHESPDGAPQFTAENDEAGFRRHVAAGYVYHVAIVGDVLAGFVAVREVTHLYHLFVDKRWHRQGIARRLWEHGRDKALEAGNPGFFTVNASNFALPLYTALGFVPTAPMQFKNSIYFTPMRLDLPRA
ncbi:GNAT family N-acetyltransferase [Massilia terrae]|uniref:GNAT family N-acetyltransferase n=1 Tax=Massilia terrae TaxID=1811224 RepID=A0ABT2CUL2_9BURK|nr:GNAT family N-acetyltransferase [Massilia terrae]MCS0657662.1 GNAT family N-acetyltransferase [Massilia terrae]